MIAMGRPTRFESETCEQAYNYRKLGATNDGLSGFFHVSPSTVDRWIARRADFGDAVNSGRIVADARVVRGLHDRAIGYDRTIERVIVVGGELKPVASTVHHPPNVQACLFRLRRRRRRTGGDAARDKPSSAAIDDIALLDAARESTRLHDGD